MQSGAQAMKSTIKEQHLDQAEDLMDDMQDAMAQIEDLNNIMSEPMGQIMDDVRYVY